MQTAHDVFNLLKHRFASLNFIHTKDNGEYKCVNSNQLNWKIIHACLAASLYPNLCATNSLLDFQTRHNETVIPHQQSILSNKNQAIGTVAVYSDRIMRGSQIMIQNIAKISPLTVILACGSSNEFNIEERTVTIGEVLKFRFTNQAHVNMLLTLRTMMDEIQSETIDRPQTFRMNNNEGQRIGTILDKIL